MPFHEETATFNELLLTSVVIVIIFFIHLIKLKILAASPLIHSLSSLMWNCALIWNCAMKNSLKCEF